MRRKATGMPLTNAPKLRTMSKVPGYTRTCIAKRATSEMLPTGIAEPASR